MTINFNLEKHITRHMNEYHKLEDVKQQLIEQEEYDKIRGLTLTQNKIIQDLINKNDRWDLKTIPMSYHILGYDNPTIRGYLK